QYGAIGEAAGEQCFQRVSFPFPREGIRNHGSNDKSAEKHRGHQSKRSKESLRPQAQGHENTEKGDQNERASTPGTAPGPFQQDLLQFFPKNRDEIGVHHLLSSSIILRNTSSRLPWPRRTSWTCPPSRTIKLTSGGTSWPFFRIKIS